MRFVLPSARWLHKLSPILIGIMLLGFALRFWGIGWGLPYTFISDEPTVLVIVLRMLRTLDFNPYWWQWPPLLSYLIAIAFTVYFSIGHWLGVSPPPNALAIPEVVTMGVGKLYVSDELLIARGVVAFLSGAAIFFIYLLAKRISAANLVWFLACSLIAISPVIVEHSQKVAPDAVAMFFLIGAIFFAVKILDDHRALTYLGAGVFAGLAIASKYNTAPVVLSILVAHLLSHAKSNWINRRLFFAGFVIVAVFIAATPYSILDFPGFWDGFKFNASAYASGGRGEPGGDAFAWYVTYLWNELGWLNVLAVLGLVQLLRSQPRKGLTLIAFPAIYFFLISQLYIRNERTLMLIIPFLFIFAGVFIGHSADWIARHLPLPRIPQMIGWGALCLALLMPSFQRTWSTNLRLNQIDGRETARVWLDANLPSGSRIAVESYSPYIDINKFAVLGIGAIADHSPDWYVQNGFEYLVLSQGMSGRFLANPEYYSEYAKKYRELFTLFPLAAQFDDNGYQVRVLKTNITMPPHRVAARFGDNGELIELVGYDVGVWKTGEPLRLKMVWRTIGETAEPFEIELRLLDKDDRQVALVRDDLFQRRGWRPGMFDGDWIVNVPADLRSGIYRLQVSVIWTKFNYRLPAQTWTGTDISPVLLGSFELE